VDTLESVIAAAESVIPRPEILVVDQSEGNETRHAIVALVEGGQVRYIPTSTVGLSRSRNILLSSTRADLVLFTDDDCTVPENWIGATLAEFDADPSAAVVFGNVEAAPAESGSITPVSIAASAFVVRSLRDWRAVDGIGIGIGASMAVNRHAALGLGGFDPLLGAGGRFHSAEDTDFAVRALMSGYAIRRSTEVCVSHAGHRTSEEFRTLTRNAMFGVGCSLSKVIRRAPGTGSAFVARMITSSIVRPALVDVTQRRRPRVFGRAAFLFRGIVRGSQTPIDRATWCFLDVPDGGT
jgi:GT2 family glycosyltransferase